MTLKKQEVTGGWKNCIMWSFIIHILHKNIVRVIKSKRMI
jgi:hypothetical protein